MRTTDILTKAMCKAAADSGESASYLDQLPFLGSTVLGGIIGRRMGASGSARRGFGATLAGATLGGVAGMKAQDARDSALRAIDRHGDSPFVQGVNAAIDAAGAATERMRDPFKDTPARKPEPTLLERAGDVAGQYWRNLKSGDPLTIAGTGTAAILAGVLTHQLLKKKRARA